MEISLKVLFIVNYVINFKTRSQGLYNSFDVVSFSATVPNFILRRKCGQSQINLILRIKCKHMGKEAPLT